MLTLSPQAKALLVELQLDPRWELLVNYLELLAPRPPVWRKDKSDSHEWAYESGRHIMASELVKILKQE